MNNGGASDFESHMNGGLASPLSPHSDSTKSDADRIAALELQVSQQADDILCLKTAFAEVSRHEYSE